MKCELTEREKCMEGFLMGKLSPQESDAFEIHVFGCPDCLEELRLREQAIKLIREERESLITDYKQRALPRQRGVIPTLAGWFPRKRPAWVYVGAAVVVLLIALLTRQFWRQENVAGRYAASFELSAHLESLLQQSMRTSIWSIEVISPRIGENFTGDISFRWKMKKVEDEFIGPLELKIMNNRERPIHTHTVARGIYELKKNLDPGLYYWTIEARGEMLFLGKFFVKNPPK
jgi:hypothetical protein